MRVALLCPYSLSVPGGVQGQGLGHDRLVQAEDAVLILHQQRPLELAHVLGVGVAEERVVG